ncbi:MAG: GDSL-type esterase/lipase family protein [bacterium]
MTIALKKPASLILLIFFGIAAGLGISEIILRTAGAVYKYRKTHRSDLGTSAAVKILCVGDSYTLGVGAPFGEGYPGHLQRLLDSECGSEERYIVINEGIPGRNSSQLAGRLEELLEKNRPEILIMLAGANNTTLLESNYHIFDAQNPNRFKRISAALKLYAFNFRTYKLGRHFLKSVAGAEDGQWEPAPCSPAAEKSLYEASEKMNSGLFYDARQQLEQTISMEDSCGQGHYLLGYVLYKLNDYQKAFTHARKTLEMDSGHKGAKWLLSKDIVLTLKEKAGPALKELLRYDLSLMLKISSAFDAKAAVLSYPWLDNKHDHIRREVANAFKVPYLDMHARFSVPDDMFKDGKNIYRAYDEPGGGHPNSKGYRVMAEAVFSLLKEKGLVSCRE